MNRDRKGAAPALLLALSFLAGAMSAATLPAGTQLHVRLRTPVAAGAALGGNQPLEAVVIVPVLQDGMTVVPAGARVLGQIKERKPAVNPSQRAILRLVFNKLQDGPASANIDATVADVDNARETVDPKGNIIGILASETLAARMEAGIRKVADRYPGLADLLSGMKEGFGIGEADPDIRYGPGVEMTLRLNKPLEWKGGASSAEARTIRPIEPANDLYTMVNDQPVQTRAERPPDPSDITNLMFIGTEEQVRQAFQQAGWTPAEALSHQSAMEAVRAVIEGRGYKEAPVSVLLLDGRAPDIVFEKQNDTFARRHHLRIWRREGHFNGKPIWVCAATHDIAIDFSPDAATFIHRIDPQIDRERAKVVNDLLFTRLPTGLSLVERPNAPKRAMNATGDELITDGRMAVLEF